MRFILNAITSMIAFTMTGHSRAVSLFWYQTRKREQKKNCRHKHIFQYSIHFLYNNIVIMWNLFDLRDWFDSWEWEKPFRYDGQSVCFLSFSVFFCFFFWIENARNTWNCYLLFFVTWFHFLFVHLSFFFRFYDCIFPFN